MGTKKGKRSANKKKSKLSNRQNNNDVTPRSAADVAYETVTAIHDNNNHKGVLYRRYKAATEAVKQWALGNRQDNEQQDDDDEIPAAISLTSIINSLHRIADTTTNKHHKNKQQKKNKNTTNAIVIPPKLLSQLETAISLRRKVSHFYERLVGKDGITTVEDLDGHAWIIDQLQAVYEKFCVVAEQQAQERLSTNWEQQQAYEEKKDDKDNLSGFAVLALDDKDEEDDDEDEGSVADQKPAAVVPKTKTEAERHADRELELKEERSFAIACTWMEMEQARDHIGDLWKDWSSNPMFNIGVVNEGGLLGVTCASRYNCQLIRTAVARTCVEFDMPEDTFVRVVADKGATAPLQEGRRVSWTVENYGTVVSMEPEKEGNVLVQPEDSDGPLLSLPTKDLIVHDDDLLTALAQVYHELKAFKFRSVPKRADNGLIKVNRQFTQQFLDENCVDMVFEGIHARNRAAFVSIALQRFLPAWVAFSHFGEEIGEADTLFRRYLREWSETRVITLHLCFSLVVLLDSAIICMEKSAASSPAASAVSHASTRTMFKTLNRICGDEDARGEAIKLLMQGGRPAPEVESSARMIWKAQFIGINTASFWKPSTLYFPWMAGEYMMLGLGANLIATSRLPAIMWKPLIGYIHVYSMLRREGFIGRIAKLEESLIRLYSKRVWFRCGIPQKGQYMSSWSISVGSTAEAALQLKGKRPQRKAFRQVASHVNDTSGLGVADISELMKIITFQSSPTSMDTEQSSADIKAMAEYECDFLLTQPILKVTMMANKVNETMTQRLFHKASKYSEDLDPYHRDHFIRLPVRAQVVYWALGLGEGKGNKETMEEDLEAVAQCYAYAFADPTCLLPANKSTYTELEFNQHQGEN